MAWNALTGQFRKREDADKEEEKGLFGSRPQGGASFSGGVAPQVQALGGFGGTGGTQGAPSSARHVNYGTLFAANEEKAKQMAQTAYRGAEKKADDARRQVSDAQSSFQQKVDAGRGAWSPIQGKHGTEIIGPGAQPTTPAAPRPYGTSAEGGSGVHVSAQEVGPDVNRAPAKRLQSVGTGRTVVIDNSPGAEERQRFDNRKAIGQAAVDAGRYRGLFGDMAYGQPMSLTPDEKQDALDYNHAVTYGQANTGKAQDYTGPESLKESMGDEAYAKAAADLKAADDAVKGLSTTEGIAQQLGYEGVEGDGSAALDAGLSQTAGQSSFKDLQRRYSNLGKTLSTAQSDSLADVGRADAASDAAAAGWDEMLDEFEKKQAPEEQPDKPPSPAEMISWADFVGAGDATTGVVSDTAAATGLQNQRAYNQLSQMGYTNDQIFKAFLEYKRRGTGNATPSADDLLAILRAQNGK